MPCRKVRQAHKLVSACRIRGLPVRTRGHTSLVRPGIMVPCGAGPDSSHAAVIAAAASVRHMAGCTANGTVRHKPEERPLVIPRRVFLTPLLHIAATVTAMVLNHALPVRRTAGSVCPMSRASAAARAARCSHPRRQLTCAALALRAGYPALGRGPGHVSAAVSVPAPRAAPKYHLLLRWPWIVRQQELR